MANGHNSNQKITISKTVLCLVLIIIVSSCGCGIIERFANPVEQKPPYVVPDEVENFHNHLFISDLHADSLLWNRNLLNRYNYGHVDIPRLVDGNVALQVFSAVTKVPFCTNSNQNSDKTDSITLLVIIQGWPIRTWGSLMERALYQADKLIKYTEKSRCEVNEACTCKDNITCSVNSITCTDVSGVCNNVNKKHLKLIKSVKDLDDLISERKSDPELVGALLAIEGAHVLEGKLDNLDKLYNKGFRMIGLTHFFDNEVGGSAHGMKKRGLNEFGKELIHKMQAKDMVIDLAHASPKLIEDVLKEIGNNPTTPVIVSHTGVRETCPGKRNISDIEIKGIAGTGGIIGIGAFEEAVCSNTIENTANAIRHVVDLVGVEHVAVGSDFDGGVKTPMDASGMALLTDALMNHQHFTEDQIKLIMGGNVVRVLRAVLPQN